ncbi:unnamed protein product [Calypogeia fissa]
MDSQALGGGGGFIDRSKTFNEFFYKSEAEKPSWMAMATDNNTGNGFGNNNEEEENLLDDAYSRYMSRTLSIDSSSGTHNYSRTGSLESSQESHYNDHEMDMEVVLRVGMCCGKCENKAKSLTQLEGVTSVVCDRRMEKVTVIGNARQRDILEACRKLFQQSKLWSPEDDLVDFNPAAPPQ